MTTLSSVHNGERARIVQIDAGKGLLSQIQHMGIKIGDLVRVIQNNKGYLIVAKGNLRLALGRGMANKIIVEKEAGKK